MRNHDENSPAISKVEIDSVTAIKIAEKYGLERGIRPWEAYFVLNSSIYNRDIWFVHNVLPPKEKYSIYDSKSGKTIQDTIYADLRTFNGREIYIDAHTGKVLGEIGYQRNVD